MDTASRESALSDEDQESLMTLKPVGSDSSSDSELRLFAQKVLCVHLLQNAITLLTSMVPYLHEPTYNFFVAKALPLIIATVLLVFASSALPVSHNVRAFSAWAIVLFRGLCSGVLRGVFFARFGAEVVEVLCFSSIYLAAGIFAVGIFGSSDLRGHGIWTTPYVPVLVLGQAMALAVTAVVGFSPIALLLTMVALIPRLLAAIFVVNDYVVRANKFPNDKFVVAAVKINYQLWTLLKKLIQSRSSSSS